MSRLHAALYHAIQWMRGEPVARILDEIEESQWWSLETMKAYQLDRLNAVLKVASRTQHYREAWRLRGGDTPVLRSLDELGSLAILDKSTVRANPDALRDPISTGPDETRITTGSSGVPLRVTRSRLAGAYGRASQLRGRGWFGVRLGDREIRFGGLALESAGRRRAHLIDFAMNRDRLAAFDLSEERLEQFWKRIQRRRPRLLYGYPSALALLAAFVERHGGSGGLSLRVIFSSSEALLDHRRALIQTAFGCPVADEYGAAEVSIIAMECPEGSLHLASENVHLEITDESGSPLPAGTEGDVVVTDLNNLTAPLVRYRLGDRARQVGGDCPCRRGLARLQVLAGSTFGLITLPDGRVVNGAVFHFLAEEIITRPDAGISEMVIVRQGNRFVARVVPRSNGNAAHVGELEFRLREILGPTAVVGIERVDRIIRRGGDKYRILVENSD